ncbi:MAG: hypothetical protein MZV64_68675 [Ignavibacteriales bacterium]|nr:hypothetical protein [Ignavibacteriales bacterium]
MEDEKSDTDILAERALKIVVPAEDQFPYTMRVISDILESNGSSSQWQLCVPVLLSLMDGGVPINKSCSRNCYGIGKRR